MPRAQPQRIDAKERRRLLGGFWVTVALLENVEGIKNFFRDLLSESETFMLARRLEIARLLCRGVPYDKIEQTLHTSPATIASVHAWLDGGFGGFREAVEKLESELFRRRAVLEKKEEERDPGSLAHLKKKYPLHFLLPNIAGEFKHRPPRKLRK